MPSAEAEHLARANRVLNHLLDVEAELQAMGNTYPDDNWRDSLFALKKTVKRIVASAERRYASRDDAARRLDGED